MHHSYRGIPETAEEFRQHMDRYYKGHSIHKLLLYTVACGSAPISMIDSQIETDYDDNVLNA